MDINAILYALGASGLFTSRAFLPAFLTASFIRWGQDIPLIGNADFIFNVPPDAQLWFTSDWCIGLLGVLALVEIAADKVPEAEEAMAFVHKYSKTTLSILTYMGVVGASDVSFLQQSNILQAGFMDVVMAGALGVLVFGTSTLRDQAVGYLREMDPDNDLGLRNLVSWFEDGWVFLGVFLIFAYPPLMLVLVALFYGMLARIRSHYQKKEEASKTTCPSCNASMYRSALECPSCHAANSTVHAIGFWGQTVEYAVSDKHTHAIDLIEHKRCPKCASRLEKHRVQQECPSCAHEPFSSHSLSEAYRSRVTARLPVVLVVCFLLGMIPIAGLIFGVIYYRLQIVSPYRRYLPLHRNFFAKWMTRLFFMVLILFQLIPVIGGFSVSIMALISYRMYRKGFVSQINKAYG